MKVRRLKKSAIYTIYFLLSFIFCISLYFVENGFKKTKEPVNYVDKTILEEEQPVINTDNVLIKPFISDNVQVISNYYDMNADESEQQKSIIYYNDTFLQNSGIIYGMDEPFDIVAIYDGEVIKIDDSEVLGKIVEIRHSNDVVSIYQLLGETSVEMNTKVKQGQKIGTSGLSNIINNNKQQLYFELAIRGQLVNAEQYFNKKIAEL